MAKKSIVFTVTTDLVYDQRMQRICDSLVNAGFSITIIGHKKKQSKSLLKKSYKQKRLSTIFRKGAFFYAEYNIRLFVKLLFQQPYNIYCAVDLDTCLPVLVIGKLKNKTLVFDAHEYFEEMEEVVSRPIIKKIWTAIGDFAIPKFNYHYTVGNELAQLFTNKYAKEFSVIRNMQVKSKSNSSTLINQPTKTIIYVGAVNVGRGLEELIEAVPELPPEINVKICGEGDKYQYLKSIAEKDNRLKSRVLFTGYLTPDELKKEIEKAWVGYLLLTNMGKSYYYSLANKFFDYVAACKPIICIDFPEYKSLMAEYEVGVLTKLNKDEIINAVAKLQQQENYHRLYQNCEQAAKRWNWEEEEKHLKGFYKNIE